jgi:hypothetical protein
MVVALVLAACAAGPGGSAAGGSSGWTEVSTAAALAGVSLLDVAAFGGGFVSVGNSPGVSGAQFGGAFTSADGSTWAAAPTGPFKDSTANVVGQVSSGLLALGSGCSVECFGFKAWLSPDGTAWTGPTAPAGDESRPTGFAQHGLAIVAISSELADPAKNDYKGYVYVSNDGSRWAAAPQGGTFDHTGFAAIAAGGTGFVIVGAKIPETGARDGAAWTASDGQRWTPATDDGTFKGATLAAVVHGAGTFLAVGSIGADGAAWTSTDGTSWVRVDGGAFKGRPLADVATSGSSYLAVGRDANGAAVWASSDGRSWHSAGVIPGAASSKLIATAIGGSHSVIVGQPLGAAPTGLVWVGPLP